MANLKTRNKTDYSVVGRATRKMAWISSLCRASASRIPSSSSLGGVVSFATCLSHHNPSTHGFFSQEHQLTKFMMEAPDVGTDTRYIDASSRNVKGLEKHLEARGIKASTTRMIFDYLRNKVIPRPDEFPFEFKEGPFEGTLLSLRRKYGDEIILVKVRAVDEYKDPFQDPGTGDYSPEDFGDGDSLQSLEHCLDKLDTCDFSESMSDYRYVKGFDEEFREFGCLCMAVYIFYGYHYSKRIKLDVFAFPDRIVVPETSLSDSSCNCLEAFDTYFKDRDYIAQQMAKQEHVPKVFGRLDESQMKVTKCLAEERFNKEKEGFTLGSFSKPHLKTGDSPNL